MQIHHPFVPGDIVRIVETDELGLVRFCDAPNEQLVGTSYLVTGTGYIESFQRACKKYKKSSEERPQRW